MRAVREERDCRILTNPLCSLLRSSQLIVRAPVGSSDTQDHIAFWIPNHESAVASKIDDYVVSVATLEANLAKFAAPETFTLDGDKSEKLSAKGMKWKEPFGCSRA